MKNKDNQNMLAMRMIYYKKKLGLTNETLAKAADLPVNTISRISSGATKEPTLKTLKKIAKALNCTIDDLQPGENIKACYVNSEIIQFVHDVCKNPNLKKLLDLSRKLSTDDMELVIALIKRIKTKEK